MKKAKFPKTSRHIGIYNDDWEAGKLLARDLGVGNLVCEVFHKFIRKTLQTRTDIADQLVARPQGKE